jgi:hypothetical protein
MRQIASWQAVEAFVRSRIVASDRLRSSVQRYILHVGKPKAQVFIVEGRADGMIFIYDPLTGATVPPPSAANPTQWSQLMLLPMYNGVRPHQVNSRPGTGNCVHCALAGAQPNKVASDAIAKKYQLPISDVMREMAVSKGETIALQVQ